MQICHLFRLKRIFYSFLYQPDSFMSVNRVQFNVKASENEVKRMTTRLQNHSKQKYKITNAYMMKAAAKARKKQFFIKAVQTSQTHKLWRYPINSALPSLTLIYATMQQTDYFPHPHKHCTPKSCYFVLRLPCHFLNDHQEKGTVSDLLLFQTTIGKHLSLIPEIHLLVIPVLGPALGPVHILPHCIFEKLGLVNFCALSPLQEIDAMLSEAPPLPTL